MKKVYKTPELKTEKVEIGVFGGYATGGGVLGTFIGFFNPLFGLCCGG